MMMNLQWQEVIFQCSLKIVEDMAENCLKPLRVSSGQAKCGSKCQAKSIHASQDSFSVIIWAVEGLDLGGGGVLVLAVFFFFFQKQLPLQTWTWKLIT